jgi:hypothetical protein
MQQGSMYQFKPFKSKCLLLCTTRFDAQKFCLHGICMCFYGYQNKQLIFLTKTECVYCAVRSESLNIIQVHLSLYKWYGYFVTLRTASMCCNQFSAIATDYSHQSLLTSNWSGCWNFTTGLFGDGSRTPVSHNSCSILASIIARDPHFSPFLSCSAIL